MPRRPKKTKPTTVRFTPENHAFVKKQADLHPDGQSGVINDAVALYRRRMDAQDPSVAAIYNAITGTSHLDEETD